MGAPPIISEYLLAAIVLRWCLDTYSSRAQGPASAPATGPPADPAPRAPPAVPAPQFQLNLCRSCCLGGITGGGLGTVWSTPFRRQFRVQSAPPEALPV